MIKNSGYYWAIEELIFNTVKIMDLMELALNDSWYNNSSSYDKINATELFANTTASDTIFISAVITLQYLNLYYLGAIIVVGVLGNGLNFISFICTKNKLHSPSYYLASLALSDAVFLAVLFIIWLNQLDIDLFDRPVIYKIFVYFSALSSCMSGDFFLLL